MRDDLNIAGVTCFCGIWIKEGDRDELVLNEACAHEATHYYNVHCFLRNSLSKDEREFEANQGAFNILTPLERTEIYVRCLHSSKQCDEQAKQKFNRFMPHASYYCPAGKQDYIKIGNDNPHLLMA